VKAEISRVLLVFAALALIFCVILVDDCSIAGDVTPRRSFSPFSRIGRTGQARRLSPGASIPDPKP
jgi:hypothetical protein